MASSEDSMSDDDPDFGLQEGGTEQPGVATSAMSNLTLTANNSARSTVQQSPSLAAGARFAGGQVAAQAAWASGTPHIFGQVPIGAPAGQQQADEEAVEEQPLAGFLPSLSESHKVNETKRSEVLDKSWAGRLGDETPHIDTGVDFDADDEDGSPTPYAFAATEFQVHSARQLMNFLVYFMQLFGLPGSAVPDSKDEWEKFDADELDDFFRDRSFISDAPSDGPYDLDTGSAFDTLRLITVDARDRMALVEAEYEQSADNPTGTGIDVLFGSKTVARGCRISDRAIYVFMTTTNLRTYEWSDAPIPLTLPEPQRRESEARRALFMRELFLQTWGPTSVMAIGERLAVFFDHEQDGNEQELDDDAKELFAKRLLKSMVATSVRRAAAWVSAGGEQAGAAALNRPELKLSLEDKVMKLVILRRTVFELTEKEIDAMMQYSQQLTAVLISSVKQDLRIKDMIAELMPRPDAYTIEYGLDHYEGEEGLWIRTIRKDSCPAPAFSRVVAEKGRSDDKGLRWFYVKRCHGSRPFKIAGPAAALIVQGASRESYNYGVDQVRNNFDLLVVDNESEGAFKPDVKDKSGVGAPTLMPSSTGKGKSGGHSRDSVDPGWRPRFAAEAGQKPSLIWHWLKIRNDIEVKIGFLMGAFFEMGTLTRDEETSWFVERSNEKTRGRTGISAMYMCKAISELDDMIEQLFLILRYTYWQYSTQQSGAGQAEGSGKGTPFWFFSPPDEMPWEKPRAKRDDNDRVKGVSAYKEYDGYERTTGISMELWQKGRDCWRGRMRNGHRIAHPNRLLPRGDKKQRRMDPGNTTFNSDDLDDAGLRIIDHNFGTTINALDKHTFVGNDASAHRNLLHKILMDYNAKSEAIRSRAHLDVKARREESDPGYIKVWNWAGVRRLRLSAHRHTPRPRP